ncbi:hypothetical protein M885DRAFT_507936 [Pelagophyceae sp. CCMP2097]|nr:hypothetical protein M885DRAFT_507936 [Pelagophyceae sp. CCMP2097]|mmetsp:Transcript_5353/g.19035  ORF Transcript_5353/g.19035 Transcript_5353/m.19035 type:complete len:529 (-) Transcript_5353:248-1834(-)
MAGHDFEKLRQSMGAPELMEALTNVRIANAVQTVALSKMEAALEAEVKRLLKFELAVREEREEFLRDKEERDEAMAQESERMAKVRGDASRVVKLNVGGARFETTRGVLSRVEDSMLGRMFGRCDAMLRPAQDGSIFIDRDGAVFHEILDFLRDADGPRLVAKMARLPDDARDAVLRELDFFGLEDAVFHAEPTWIHDAAWRLCAPMLLPRSECAAVLLPSANGNGKVCVIGGCFSRAAAAEDFETTEVLDLETMVFSQGPSLLCSKRLGCAAVSLGEGRVWVVGGRDCGGNVDTTEVLDFTTGKTIAGPLLASARGFCAAVRLDEASVLVVGGDVDRFLSTAQLSTCEILDVETMTLRVSESPPKMLEARSACAAVALGAGRVLVVGGHTGSKRLASTEIFDSATMAFTAGPPMLSARSGCCAVRVSAQHVLVIGGWDENYHQLSTTEVLSLVTMDFEPGPDMVRVRYACAAVALANERVLVVGGYDEKYLDSTEMLAVTSAEPESDPLSPLSPGRHFGAFVHHQAA